MKKITKEEIIEMFLSDDVVVDKHPDDPDAPTFEELQEKIRSGEVKVEIPPQLHVFDLEEYVDEVMATIGMEEAFVTDFSRIGDFGLTEEEALEAMEVLGIEMEPGDYIYQVAQRLKDSRE